MKRDNDALRQILLDTEKRQNWRVLVHKTLDMSAEDDKFGYHVELLCDAGLMTRTSKDVFRMTNQGHDYLEAVRNDTVWNKTKDGAAKVGGMTLGMFKDLAVAYLKQEVAEKLGVTL